MQHPLRTSFLFPLFLVLAETISYLSTDMYLPALPAIAKSLYTVTSLVQMTLTVWFLGSASLQLFLGPLSDRFGRKPILLTGGFLFITSTLVCALTSHIYVLLLARFFQGCSVAFVIVAGYSSIHELFEQKKAIQTLSWMNSVSILAPAFGPLAGSLLLNFGSYRLIFWSLGAAGLICFLLLILFMPETNPHGKTSHPLKFNKILKSYQSILCNTMFLQYTLTFSFIMSAFIAWISYSPFLFIEAMGYSPMMYGGCFQLLVFGSFIIGTRAIKPLMEKLDLNKLIWIGLFFLLAGSFSAIFFVSFTSHWTALIFPLMFFALGAGLIFAPLNRLTIESSPEPMGQKVAVFTTFTGMFCVLGSSLVSAFYDGTALTLALIMGSGAVIAFVINLTRKKAKS